VHGMSSASVNSMSKSRFGLCYLDSVTPSFLFFFW
jgi:hypothetical protein